MRCLIISDIHSNLAALETVLEDAPDFEQIWCLGDIVGYGPDPNECVEKLRDYPHICVAGNHDWAIIDLLAIEDFNSDAQQACRWTQEQITAENREYIENLPTCLLEEGFTLVHGSPRFPIWEYIFYPSVAKSNFAYFDTQFCLVGHTHAPVVFRYWMDQDGNELCEPFSLPLNGAVLLGEDRLIINPGSVGQPRDGDARASYAILETEDITIEHYRVPYPVEITQKKMRDQGLPSRLISRLSYGW